MPTEKLTTLFTGIISIILILAVLKIAQVALMPLAIAILLFFVFSPFVDLLERVKIPRILSIIIVILIFSGIFYLLGLFMYTSIKSFIVQLPKYQARMATLIMEVSKTLFERFSLNPGVIRDFDWSRALQSSLLSVSNSIMGVISNLLIITLFLVFMLMEKDRFQSKIRQAFHISMSDRIYLVMRHINDQIGRYLSVKFVISLATGILIYVSLMIIGLDFPILWASFAFFLNFIPNLGSAFIVFIIILMSFLQFYPEPKPIFLVAGSVIAIQVTLGNILDPFLQGRRLNLSPFLILVALLVWGWLWGVVGMFLAVPIMAMIKIVCENVPSLKAVAILMGSGKEIRESRRALRKLIRSTSVQTVGMAKMESSTSARNEILEK